MGPSRPRVEPCFLYPLHGRQILHHWATGEAPQETTVPSKERTASEGNRFCLLFLFLFYTHTHTRVPPGYESPCIHICINNKSLSSLLLSLMLTSLS